MQAYYELRRRLADFYGRQNEWERAAKEIGLDATQIVLQGTSITVWSNILGAARSPERMGSLLKLIADELPELTPVAKTYATDVANGEGLVADFPELQTVVLTDRDFAPAAVGAMLKFSEILPLELLAMSLQSNRPDDDDLDGALAGDKTTAAKSRLAQIRNQHAQERALLRNRQSTVQSSLGKLESSIKEIERTQPPSRPEPPMMQNVGPDAWNRLNRQHRDNVEIYEARLATYQADQKRLGPLQEQARGFRRDIDQLSSELASQKARAEVEERGFLSDVSQARDKDFRLTLDRTLDGAAALFRSEKNAFKGFWTLLGASCLLDLFERVASEATAIAATSATFARGAEALVPSIKARLPEIGKGCLTGVEIVNQALAVNTQALAALKERLTQLPAVELEQGCKRARRLLDVPQPAVPEYAQLEAAEDIKRVTVNLKETRSSTVPYIESLKAELQSESPELRGAINSALSDARSSIGGIRAVGAQNADTLDKNRILWTLIRRGDASSNLPVYVRTLCAALPQEVARRMNTPVQALTDGAAASEFGLADAQALLDRHVLTAYGDNREKIQRRLADSEKRLAKIESELVQGEDVPRRVAEKYRTQLKTVAVLSAVPGVGLATTFWTFGLLDRLKPLIVSDEAVYIKLGSFELAAMGWATALSGAAAAAATVVTAASYSDQLFDGSEGGAAAIITAACWISFAFSIRHLLTVRRHLRERGKLFPGAAG